MDSNLGAGIAIAGIWVGVGLCSFNAPTSIIAVAGTAIAATVAVAFFLGS